jgi:co-chaperonin GroES (HSP10)
MLESSDNIRPLRDRVFVKELPWPNVSGGGIFLPDRGEKREEVWHAVVIAVGPGKPPIGLLRRALGLLDDVDPGATLSGDVTPEAWAEKREQLCGDVRDGIAVGFGADVKPGDVVLVSKYVHTKVRVGGEWCSIIGATDILGVVTDGGDQVGSALRRALERANGGLG